MIGLSSAGPLKGRSTFKHCHRQGIHFRILHALNTNSHREGCHLIIRHFPADKCIDDPSDFVFGEYMRISLFCEDLCGVHHSGERTFVDEVTREDLFLTFRRFDFKLFLFILKPFIDENEGRQAVFYSFFFRQPLRFLALLPLLFRLGHPGSKRL